MAARSASRRRSDALAVRATRVNADDSSYQAVGCHESLVRAVSGKPAEGDMVDISKGPYFEIAAAELAAWLEAQGIDRWWNVDGDPLLTSRLSFPCPGDELAADVRTINRPLLIQARKDDASAKGQRIDRTNIDELTAFLVGNSLDLRDRVLCLCWKPSTISWLLIEDSDTTESNSADVRELSQRD